MHFGYDDSMAESATAARNSREGTLLAGKYQLEKHIGSGAMGDVFRAQNTMLGRMVAIKLLRPEHAHNTEIVERFLREAKTATIVRHPNVVDMLDVGQDEFGSPYIVQEFLQGDDFSQYIEKHGGRLDPRETIDIMLPVVEAIEFAHARGVVHRDLKPENIFLATEGSRTVPKLLDFGISQVRTAESVRMTATGLMMGTPAYMSPEQIIRGAREADAQTDVWALGIILFEVLCGELPFMAETASALFVEIATKDAPSLAERDPSLPPDLVKIVARCLRRERADRYPSGCELARDLRHWRDKEKLEGTKVLSLSPPGLSESSKRAAAAPVLANKDIPSLTKAGSAPRAKPIEELNVPQISELRKKEPKSAARVPSMQEIMDDGGAFDDDDDGDHGDLELDVPVSHRSVGGSGTSPGAVSPTSRRGSGLDVDGGRMSGSIGGMPMSNRALDGFHSSPRGGGRVGEVGHQAQSAAGTNFTVQDMINYSAVAIAGIISAGGTRYLLHHDETVAKLLEANKGNIVLGAPGILCLGASMYCVWQAGSTMRGEARGKAAMFAVVAGILLALALDALGAM